MTTYHITSRQNPLVKSWVNLNKDKQGGLFLVEGAHLVEMAANHHALVTYISVDEANPYSGVDHYIIHPSIADKLSTLSHSPGVFGICKKQALNLDFTQPMIFLDDLRDPGNMGTIMRSALAFGFYNVVSSTNSVDVYNEKVVSAGQGAHFLLHLARLDRQFFIVEAKKAGYQIIVTTLEQASEISSLPSEQKVVIVIGNEARGVSEWLIEQADIRIKINMTGKIDSLNAGVAASIMMHQHFISRQIH